MSGVHTDGGYAEMMIAKANALAAIPDELNPVEAAPLLCAGLTTFNALRKSKARAGDLVAIQGVGGLGHLAIQFARYMGFKVAAISRGAEKRDLALTTSLPHWPRKVTLDGHTASHLALRLLRREDPRWKFVQVRSCRYLNNIVEQDHRAIKRRCASMTNIAHVG
jgi:hypothetical protein